MNYNHLYLSLLCLSLATSSLAFAPTKSPALKTSSSALFFTEDSALDKAEAAEPLPLTAEDLAAIAKLVARDFRPYVVPEGVTVPARLNFFEAEKR